MKLDPVFGELWVEFEKVIIETFHVLLHRPVTIKTVFLPHPSFALLNVEPHVFLECFGFNQVSFLK